MGNKKIVLAYSGGLDTSVAVKWLTDKSYLLSEELAEFIFRAPILKMCPVKSQAVWPPPLRRSFYFPMRPLDAQTPQEPASSDVQNELL